jgi:hypothetical protein
MIRRHGLLIITSMGILMASIIIGAAVLRSAGAAEVAPPIFSIQKLGVMPFFRGSYGSDITANLTCPVCELTYDPDNLTPDCDRVLTQNVQEVLGIRYGEKMIPPARVKEVYHQIPQDEFKDTPLSLTQKVGKALSANAMIVGTVWKYRNRVGGSGAVESPASVAFAVYLVEVDTGKVIWNKTFAQTQRSLFENILNARSFFEEGAKWLTADQLAEFGVRETFKDFPY